MNKNSLSEQIRTAILRCERAVRNGIITYDEYEAKMKELGGVISLSRQEWERINNWKL